MSKDCVVVTASAGAFPDLAGALRDLSVQVEARPLLTFEPPLDWSVLDAALEQAHRYQAMALTSPRAARAVALRIEVGRLSWDHTAPAVWVVGSATEEGLGGRVGPVLKPDAPARAGESAAAALARAMLKASVAGPVLFPCGDRRRDELPATLRSRGILVDEVVCYRSVLASRDQAREATMDCAVLVVASPSVAALLVEACPEPSRPRMVAIGAATAEAARVAGWPPAAVADKPSTAALAAAITGLLAAR
jgi:uroporphyrinogen-III synthase